MNENQLSNVVIGAALKVHRNLGPGLLESAYENCLLFELLELGLSVERQKPLPLVYKEIKLEAGFRIDLMINKKLIIEVKSADAINDIHMAQVLTYLKLTGCELGIIINFNTVKLKDGIRRVILSRKT